MKELHMAYMGGKMKKIICIFFLLVSLILKANDFNEIIIDYGNKDIGRKFKYDFVELTEYKIVISKDKIKYFKPFIKEIEIRESEYNLIYKIADDTIQKEKLVNCYDNINVEADIYREKAREIEEPINVKIRIKGKDYCMVGKNDLLEYLNNKYDLQIKWKSGTFPKIEIKNDFIMLE